MIAQALAEAAVRAGHHVIFIGSMQGQDRNYFEGSSLFDRVYFLETTGVVNQKGLQKIKALWRIFRAFLAARRILKEQKIEATYSVGGFSSAAASLAALSRRTPLFIHEQNAVEGRLNRLLKPYATSFLSAYAKDTPIKGYPVKEIFFAANLIYTVETL